jgi:hypothetical protein
MPHLPFKRSKGALDSPLQKAAARAGLIRLAVRQRTLHPRPAGGRRMLRALRRS